MIFMVRYEIDQAHRKAAIERFLATGGLPPEGATLLHRWHSADGAYGVAIIETDDVQTVAKLSVDWNDLISIDARPALDDEGMGAVLTAG